MTGADDKELDRRVGEEFDKYLARGERTIEQMRAASRLMPGHAMLAAESKAGFDDPNKKDHSTFKQALGSAFHRLCFVLLFMADKLRPLQVAESSSRRLARS